MTIQEALEILMRENSSGMSPEELIRRETLVRGLATSNPELARQVASGPYQMNVGNSNVGDTATPTEAWQRGGQPSAMSNKDYPYSPSSNLGKATPSTTGPMVAGQPPAWMTSAPKDYNGNSVGQFQGPPDRNGNVQGGQMPTININVGGQPQGPAPSWMTQAPPDWRGTTFDQAYGNRILPQPQSSPPPSWMTQAPPDWRGTTFDQAYGNRILPQPQGLTARDFPMQPDPNYRFPQFDTRVRQPLPQTFGNLSR